MHYFHFEKGYLHFKMHYFHFKIHYFHFKMHVMFLQKHVLQMLLKVKYVKVGPAPSCRRLLPWPVRIAWTKIRLCGRIVNMCRFFYNFVCKLAHGGLILPRCPSWRGRACAVWRLN